MNYLWNVFKNCLNIISWVIIWACFAYLVISILILYWYIYLIIFGAAAILILTKKNEF